LLQVVQFLQNDKYAHFERIIFDTAPTGHTLRLLTLPDFLDASLGKVIRLRAKLLAAADAVKSFITGKKAEEDPAVKKMEELRVRGWQGRGGREGGQGQGAGAGRRPWETPRLSE
jgi:anion-transporting  ArsA/GET3 family ATPase